MDVYLKAYLRGNLGDDLFVKIITDRYSNTNFHALALKKYKEENKSNLKIKSGYKYVYLNKFLEILTKGKISLDRYFMKKYDKTVIIGGSIFIQYKNHNYPNIYEKELKNKDYYIIGANFGPYNTREYLESVKKLVHYSKDTCFRDSYSYNIFKEFDSVRYSPDIALSMNLKDAEIKEKKEVIISVIDCNKKFNKSKTKAYEAKILELIRHFIKLGYSIILMSFCKFQGDEIAIRRILKKLTPSEKKYIKKYFYRGKINEALNIIAGAKIVVGTRFHANILGLLFNKIIIPIAYSNKTVNALKDLGFKEQILNIESIENFNVKKITEEQLNYKINIQKQIKESRMNFYELDKVLD